MVSGIAAHRSRPFVAGSLATQMWIGLVSRSRVACLIVEDDGVLKRAGIYKIETGLATDS